MNNLSDYVSVFCIGFGTGIVGFAGVLGWALSRKDK